jgi:dihydroorotate dehydrogenase
MGFNNSGAEAFAQKLSEWRASGRWPNHPVGINLGKSKIAALDRAAEDYARSFRALRPHVDFVVVNVSSPNTPGLRQLQDKSALDEILAAIQQVQSEGLESPASSETPPNPRHSSLVTRHSIPILVKVAPDLSFEALDEILELVSTRQIAGIVATNTTISRPETADAGLRRIYAESGGLSGRPLRARSTEVIRHLFKQTNGRLPIIGSGGIFNAADAWEKLVAGASLLQLYTALVYEGPGIAKSIVRGLLTRMEVERVSDLRKLVGSAVP